MPAVGPARGPHGRRGVATGSSVDRPGIPEGEGCSDGVPVPVPLRGAHRLSFCRLAGFDPIRWLPPRRSHLLPAFHEKVDLLARISRRNSARGLVRVLLPGWKGHPAEWRENSPRLVRPAADRRKPCLVQAAAGHFRENVRERPAVFDWLANNADGEELPVLRRCSAAPTPLAPRTTPGPFPRG